MTNSHFITRILTSLICLILAFIASYVGLLVSYYSYVAYYLFGDFHRIFCPAIGFVLGMYITGQREIVTLISIAAIMMAAWLLAEVALIPGTISESISGENHPWYYFHRHDFLSYGLSIIAGLVALIFSKVLPVRNKTSDTHQNKCHP